MRRRRREEGGGNGRKAGVQKTLGGRRHRRPLSFSSALLCVKAALAPDHYDASTFWALTCGAAANGYVRYLAGILHPAPYAYVSRRRYCVALDSMPTGERTHCWGIIAYRHPTFTSVSAMCISLKPFEFFLLSTREGLVRAWVGEY